MLRNDHTTRLRSWISSGLCHRCDTHVPNDRPTWKGVDSRANQIKDRTRSGRTFRENRDRGRRPCSVSSTTCRLIGFRGALPREPVEIVRWIDYEAFIKAAEKEHPIQSRGRGT